MSPHLTKLKFKIRSENLYVRFERVPIRDAFLGGKGGIRVVGDDSDYMICELAWFHIHTQAAPEGAKDCDSGERECCTTRVQADTDKGVSKGVVVFVGSTSEAYPSHKCNHSGCKFTGFHVRMVRVVEPELISEVVKCASNLFNIPVCTTGNEKIVCTQSFFEACIT